jgi:hypothetical protein
MDSIKLALSGLSAIVDRGAIFSKLMSCGIATTVAPHIGFPFASVTLPLICPRTLSFV